MEIIKQWIVDGYKHLVLLSDNTYMIGSTSNIYGFEKISNELAEGLITQSIKK